MTHIPRPESRLSELESHVAIQDARIRELSTDLRQDIKQLSDDMTASFKQIGEHFGLLEKEYATKADLEAVETRLSERIGKIEEDVDIVAKEIASFRVKNEQLLLKILARLPEKGEG